MIQWYVRFDMDEYIPKEIVVKILYSTFNCFDILFIVPTFRSFSHDSYVWLKPQIKKKSIEPSNKNDINYLHLNYANPSTEQINPNKDRSFVDHFQRIRSCECEFIESSKYFLYLRCCFHSMRIIHFSIKFNCFPVISSIFAQVK